MRFVAPRFRGLGGRSDFADTFALESDVHVHCRNSLEVHALSWSFPHHSQLELAVSRGRHKQHRNGDGPSGAGSGNSATSTTSSKTRPAHTKVLRAKDASYSEGILQDFRREEIPAELAKFYDMQGETSNQEGWAWVGIILPGRLIAGRGEVGERERYKL